MQAAPYPREDLRFVAVNDLFGLLPPFVAAVVCAIASRAADEPRVRVAWRLIALAWLAWGVGEAIWVVYEVGLGRPTPFPSAADGGYLLMVPLSMAGIITFSSGPLGVSRIRLMLDCALMTSSAIAIVWPFALWPIIGVTDQTWLPKILACAYPFGDALLLVALALVLREPWRGRESAVLLTLAAGLSVFLLADLSFTVLSLQGTYVSGQTFTDAAWVISPLLVGYAAIMQVCLRPSFRAESLHRVTSFWRRSVPTAFFAVLLVEFAILLVTDSGGLRPASGLLVLAGFVLLAREFMLTAETEGVGRALENLAYHDALTGLRNRKYFVDKLEAEVGSRSSSAALILLDLDDFKRINDRHGHATGDQVLIAVAARLSGVAGKDDTVARLGGDEFAILVRDVTRAREVARLIMASLESELVVGDATIEVAASQGIAEVGSLASDAATILRSADGALYEAKRNAKGWYRLAPSHGPLAQDTADLTDIRLERVAEGP